MTAVPTPEIMVVVDDWIMVVALPWMMVVADEVWFDGGSVAVPENPSFA